MISILLKVFAFIIPLIPMYVGIKVEGVPLINIQRIVAGAIVSLLIVNIFLNGSYFSRLKIAFFRGGAISYFVASLFAFKLFSAIFSEDFKYSSFIFLLELVLQAAIFLAVLASVKKNEDFISYIKIFTIGYFFVVVISLVEWALSANPFTKIMPSSMMDFDYLRGVMSDKMREGEYRVQATFMHPLALAEYILIVLPLIFTYFVHKGRIVFSVFIAFAGGVTIILSGSRAGIAVYLVQSLMLMATLVFYLKNKGRWLSISSILFSCFIAFIFSFGFIGDKVTDIVYGKTNSESMSTEARITQIAKGVQSLNDRPLIGFGPGLAINYAATYNVTTGERSIDNYYLSLALDSGYIALLLFLTLLIICLFKSGYDLFYETGFGLRRAYSFGFAISLFCFIVYISILSSNELFPLLFILIPLYLNSRVILAGKNESA